MAKSFQICFQISVNVFHVNGISVIYVTVPRLFSLLHCSFAKSGFGLAASN